MYSENFLPPLQPLIALAKAAGLPFDVVERGIFVEVNFDGIHASLSNRQARIFLDAILNSSPDTASFTRQHLQYRRSFLVPWDEAVRPN